MSLQTNNNIAWITGAGTGIGRAVALKLAKQGWKVVVSARTAAHLQEIADLQPDNIIPLPLDVTDSVAISVAYNDIITRFGAIDLAILNAGTYHRDSAFEFNSQSFTQTINVNLVGTATTLSCVMPDMLKRKRGRILVVASVAGYTGLPGAAAYGASKAGLINMCESLYPELYNNGVYLSVVNPGFVDTPLTKKNDFPMPFIISEDKAADHIISGLSATRFEIAFPWKMVFVTKLLAILPARLRFSITRRMLR